jgi:hypothetical protein
MIVVFPGERAFGARLLNDTALLRRQSIDRLLRLSVLHMSLQYFVGEPSALLLALKVRASLQLSQRGTKFSNTLRV